MTIKEITALRKAGRLDEALQAAETEFEQSPNSYTCAALFWCLYDLSKLQNREDAIITIERMKALYEEYYIEEDVMQKAIIAADNRMIPHYTEVKETVLKAKSGINVAEAYSDILKLFNSSELDKSLYPDFGWLIYYVLKNIPLTDAYNRKLLLAQYLKLNLSRPSLLHTLILGEAIKIEQTTPLQFRIRDFIRLWGLENLVDGDWEQFKTEAGHILPSTVEKLIGVYAKEIKTDGVPSPDEFNKLVDIALEKFPQNQNMPYFKAIVLLSNGRKEEAISYYRDLILKFPSKFYLWSQVAELVENADTKIGLLSKALSTEDDDAFLGSIRLRLARLLITKDLTANAKYELQRYYDTYTIKGWTLKPEYWELANQLPNVTPLENNQKLYSEYSRNADEFIYSGLPTKVAVKVFDKLIDDRNRPGKKIIQWTLRSRDGVLRLRKPRRFGLDNKAINGSVFETKVLNSKIVWIKPSQINPLQQDWIRKIDGYIKLRKDRNGKDYGLLDGVYIDQKFLSEISNNENVKIIALKQDDGRWSAISLTKI